MNISVLIATYKRPELLKATLESFLSLNISGIDWEILIADNCGDAATEQAINDFKSKLPITFIVERKRGKNNALNSLLLLAKGELMVFTDDDIIAERNWIISLWQGAVKWKEFNVFGGKTLAKWPNNTHFKYKLKEKRINTFFGTTYSGHKEGPYFAQEAFGANMAIRKCIFDAGWRYNPSVGPKGENYIMGSETELLSRLEVAGDKAVYLPSAIVYHQIRKEQLTKKWLYRRAFKAGRSIIFHENNTSNISLLFGTRRYLIRNLAVILVKRVFIYLTFNQTRRLEAGLMCWLILGEIYQSRIQIKDSDKQTLKS